MKNPQIKKTLLILLIVASGAAYTFLNTVALNKPEQNCCKVDEKEQLEKRTIAPEVKLVKMILEKGRQLLPAS